MEDEVHSCTTCDCFADLPAADKQRLTVSVRTAVDNINRTLEQIGLTDCHVDEVTFGRAEPTHECVMQCGVDQGTLRCWCE